MTNLQPLNWPSAGKCLHCMLISIGTPRLVLHFLFLQKQKSSWFVTYFATKVVRCDWYVRFSPFKVEVTWLSRMLDYSPLASSQINIKVPRYCLVAILYSLTMRVCYIFITFFCQMSKMKTVSYYSSAFFLSIYLHACFGCF